MKVELDRELHPVMFKSNPLGFVLAVILIPLGIGVIILLLWNFRCRRTSVRLTESEVVYRRRLFREQIYRIPYADIANVILGQTICSRRMDAGSVLLVTGHGDIVLEGMPAPGEIEKFINRKRGRDE